MTCRHCSGPCGFPRRGLCFRCYRDPAIRERYRPLLKNVGRGRPEEWEEPTQQQVDDCVAEQSKPENLPDWWWDHDTD